MAVSQVCQNSSNIYGLPEAEADINKLFEQLSTANRKGVGDKKLTMNHYTDLERIRGTIEELSLKKQLPLRQQTDKPILKYDTSLTKPVQLFNQSNTLVHRDSRSPLTTTPTSNTSSHNGSASSQKARNTGSRPSHSSPAKGVNNPYSRPLSAKEVSEDVHRNRRMPGSSQSVMSAMNNGIPQYDHEADCLSGASALQLNSFLRPQSGVRRDSTPNKVASQKKGQRIGSGGGDTCEVNSQASGGKHILDETQGHKRAKGPLPSEQSAKASLHQAFYLASTTSACSSRAAVTGLPPRPKNGSAKESKSDVLSGQQARTNAGIRNPNYSPNKPYSEVCDSIANDAGRKFSSSDNSAGSSQQAVFNTKQPLTKASAGKPPNGLLQSSKFNSSSPESQKGMLGRSGTSSRVEHSVLGQGDAGKTAVVGENGVPLQNVMTGSLLQTKVGMLRKMPVTNTLTGTLYYKKSFREATKVVEQKQKKPDILEHRPGGDGAPCKHILATAEEKVVRAALSDDGEEEDDDDISFSTPSGERLPGDGEASIEDLDDDDDGIDDLYESSQGDAEDEDSDDYTISSTMSQHSSSTVRLRSAASRPSTTQSDRSRAAGAGEERTRSFIRPVTSSGETVTQPALRQSLFPAIPPTINFIAEGEKVEQLPWEIRKFLKWRMSPITPNVVKSALGRINFRVTKKNHDWLGCFGKHMKANAFKSLREYQKLNHFPGSFQLGRKDRLWRNLSKLQVSFGKKEFGFFPQTYVLPQDLKQLKRTWEDSTSRQKWIIKPPASARGIGIKVINKWNQIPRKRPVIVQKYLAKPLLINDSKFDMRVYVYVTSYDPLRAYVFEDGLARFASCKYSSSMKNLSNKFMHLTNYSINKRNADYQSNTDESVCQGHKWSLKALWNYLKKQGVNTQAVWESIKDIVVKTLISAEASINSMVKSNVRSRYVVHELFGFDILLDDQYRPWILEVNISPSLHSNSPLDTNIKGQMIRDMMNLAGFRVPDKNDIVHSAHASSSSAADLSSYIPSTDYCMDKRLFTSQMAPDERAKHAYFCHKHQDEQVLQGIVDTLTPDDIRMLTESIDEDSRKGGFIRVFPTPSTKKYLRFFEQPRYYNLLLDQWVTRYNRMEQRGIALLQGLCEEGIHLENPTDSARHQWCPLNSSAMLSARDKLASPLKRDAVLGQVKSSPSLARLPKVRTAAGVSLSPSSLSHATGSSFLTTPHSSPPVPRVARPLDPSR